MDSMDICLLDMVLPWCILHILRIQSNKPHDSAWLLIPDPSWWLNQPIWKMLVKMGILPK